MGKLLVQRLPEMATRWNAVAPAAAHPGEDICYDLYAAEDSFLMPGRITKTKTGIAALYISRPYTPWLRKLLDRLHLLPHYGLVIRDRSGMAAKGIHVLGGEIDAGYRGDITVVQTLLGPPLDDYPNPCAGHPVGYRIHAGDKIAQIRPVRLSSGNHEIVDTLPSSARGAKGFGSTGK